MPTQRPAYSVRCQPRSTSASSCVPAASTAGGGCSVSQLRNSSRSSSSGSVSDRARTTTGRSASADRSELEMQVLETPHQVDGRVLVAAVVGRAVLRLGDPDVGHTVEETVDADVPFGAGEWRAGAGVDAEPEPDVLATVRAVELELRRILELARIPVRRAGHDEHVRPRGDIDLADLRRDPCQSELTLDRARRHQA